MNDIDTLAARMRKLEIIVDARLQDLEIIVDALLEQKKPVSIWGTTVDARLQNLEKSLTDPPNEE